jgi:hypothetical protein
MDLLRSGKSLVPLVLYLSEKCAQRTYWEPLDKEHQVQDSLIMFFMTLLHGGKREFSLDGWIEGIVTPIVFRLHGGKSKVGRIKAKNLFLFYCTSHAFYYLVTGCNPDSIEKFCNQDPPLSIHLIKRISLYLFVLPVMLYP